MRFNLNTGAASPVGETGYKNIVGIAYHESRRILYGVSGGRYLMKIDPTTGAAYEPVLLAQGENVPKPMLS